MRYTKHFEVSSHDVDVNNHIKPSSLQRYMMETGMCQMRDRKPAYSELFAKDQAFILTRVTIEIFHQIQQFTEIEVQTWNCPAKGVTFNRCFEVHCNGELMARAHTVWGVASPTSGKLWKANEVDISNYESEEALEMNLPTRLRFPKDLAFQPVGNKTVLYGEVDMNMHMNNTYYMDVLWNYIPDILDKEVTSVSLRYHAEAPLGAQLQIQMTKLPETLAGDESAEETWCFKTFVDGELNLEAMVGVKEKSCENREL
jgi:acyl-ACP thioesterase